MVNIFGLANVGIFFVIVQMEKSIARRRIAISKSFEMYRSN